tara:strand:+ start:231 stop:629 length:399 start_codon:yes stop_codon:yes gene_type:complete
MKTYKDFQTEILGFSARKAKARAMSILNRKASTAKKKMRNMMKSLSQDDAKKKAEKAARKTMMQKILGKGKDLADLSIAQKEKLEKKTDDKVKKMGAAYQGLVKKMTKVVKKKHNVKMKAMKAKRQADNTGV